MSTWTREAIATLKRLHPTGIPFSEIAAAIGNGMSRNAVIGKAKRLGMLGDRRMPAYRWEREAVIRLRQMHEAGHDSADIARTLKIERSTVEKKLRALKLTRGVPGRPKAKTITIRPKKSQPVRPEPPRPPACEPVSLLNLEHRHCRFPIGEACGPDTLFCGAPKMTGSSYCTYHQGVATGQGTLSERAATGWVAA
jgi:GcrA cell cycle regulator